MTSSAHFELRQTLDGHKDAVWGSCTSSTGDSLYTASWDGTVASWDIITGEQQTSMSGHTGKVFCVATGDGAQGSVLVSGSEDKSIRSWSVVDGTCEGVMEDAHDGSVVSIQHLQYMYYFLNIYFLLFFLFILVYSLYYTTIVYLLYRYNIPNVLTFFFFQTTVSIFF